MKHGLVTLCTAFLLAIAACGGGGDGNNDADLGGNVPDDGGNVPDDGGNVPDDDGSVPDDSLAVCDPCQVDTLSTGFGECIDACRVDCPEQFSECRDACLDECDGCGTGLSCLFSRETRTYRCGPRSELTTCDGVEYGGGT